jgi:hypothetical protein
MYIIASSIEPVASKYSFSHLSLAFVHCGYVRIVDIDSLLFRFSIFIRLLFWLCSYAELLALSDRTCVSSAR